MMSIGSTSGTEGGGLPPHPKKRYPAPPPHKKNEGAENAPEQPQQAADEVTISPEARFIAQILEMTPAQRKNLETNPEYIRLRATMTEETRRLISATLQNLREEEKQ